MLSLRLSCCPRMHLGVVYSAVHLVRHLAAILMVVLMSGAPTMACAMADAPMTPAERACCRMMKNQCGDMQMSDSRSCCQKAPHTADATAPQWKVSELHGLTLTVAVYAVTALYPPAAYT